MKKSNKKSIDKPSFPSLNFEKSFWTASVGEKEPSTELKEQRKRLGVLVKGNNLDKCPPPIEEIDLAMFPSESGALLNQMNVKQPSPIQMQAWPIIMCGNDVLGIAPTGSGKTLAYVLPLIPHIVYQTKLKSNAKSMTRRPTVRPYITHTYM